MRSRMLKVVVCAGLWAGQFGVAQAHDPKEHAKEAEAPKCEALESDALAGLDADSPIVNALMEQCHEAHKGNDQTADDNGDDAEKDDEHHNH